MVGQGEKWEYTGNLKIELEWGPCFEAYINRILNNVIFLVGNNFYKTKWYILIYD